MTQLSAQIVQRTLRAVEHDRVVLEARLDGVSVCTRVLLAPVDAHLDRLVRAIAVDGRGSAVGLPSLVTDVLEAYRIRARLRAPAGRPHALLHHGVLPLPEVLAAGVATDLPAEVSARPPAGKGWVYVTTRWVEGRPLDAAYAAADAAGRRELLANVAAAVARLHDRLVSFGDLKPSNVVVDDGRVGLIDLDTLREVPDVELYVKTTAATQEYAAPEQLERQETWLASDVWAFGELASRLHTNAPRVADEGPYFQARGVIDPVNGDVWAEERPALPMDQLIEVLVRRCQARTPGLRPKALDLVAWLRYGVPLPDREVTARVAEPETTRRVAEPSVAAVASAAGAAKPTEAEITRPVVSAGPTPPPFRRLPLPSGAPVSASAAPGAAVAPTVAAPAPSAPVAEEGTVGESAVVTVEREVEPTLEEPAALARAATRLRMLVLGVGAVAAIVAGWAAWSAWGSFTARANACAALGDLRVELRAHKTVAAQNDRKVLDGLVPQVEAQAAVCQTPESKALVALVNVWQARWHHMGAVYRAEAFNAIRPLVDAVRGSEVPEAQMAVVGFDGGLCRLLPDGSSERVTACARAHEAARGALDVIHGDTWRWLRVEVAWSDAMTALGEAQRLRLAKNVEASRDTAASTLPLCFSSFGDLDFAPVNGPEMLETCMRLAGIAERLEDHAKLAGYALRLATQTQGGIDTKKLGRIYETVAPECAEIRVGKDKLPEMKGSGDGGQADWCRLAAARAVGCGDRIAMPVAVQTCSCCTYFLGCRDVEATDGACPTADGWRCDPKEQAPARKPNLPWARLDGPQPAQGCPL